MYWNNVEQFLKILRSYSLSILIQSNAPILEMIFDS